MLHYIDMLKMSLLKGKIVALDHYHSPGDKTNRQGQHFNIPQKELPSLAYFTTTIQIVNQKSYKEKWSRLKVYHLKPNVSSYKYFKPGGKRGKNRKGKHEKWSELKNSYSP